MALEWPDLLKRCSNGTVLKSFQNACLAFGEGPVHEAIGFDEFRNRVWVTGVLPWSTQKDRPFTNTDYSEALLWLDAEAQLRVQPIMAFMAVDLVAKRHAFHPVRSWLESLQWDAAPRCDTWLSRYLGAEPSDYMAAVGARWLIQAVARIMQPGCKADSVLILEGPQGIEKSTALRVLAGHDWFTDQISALGSKDAKMEMAGVWIIELAELDKFTAANAHKAKAFFSQTSERFRTTYGRVVDDCPRQCVFAGTTNPSYYLKEDTGYRRYWPVRCGSINTDALRHDRDQIWAEAVIRYFESERYWIGRDEPDLVAAAAEVQALREEPDDPWHELVAAWLDTSWQPKTLSTREILVGAIGKPASECDRRDSARINSIMTRCGWEMTVAKPCGTSMRVWRRRG